MALSEEDESPVLCSERMKGVGGCLGGEVMGIVAWGVSLLHHVQAACRICGGEENEFASEPRKEDRKTVSMKVVQDRQKMRILAINDVERKRAPLIT